MYSLTWKGGQYGGGTVLAIKADGSDYRILQQFGPQTGLNNTAAPTISPDGQRLLFTSNGGKYPMGALYSMQIPASVR
jgi:Tol biopolymer transport system component